GAVLDAHGVRVGLQVVHPPGIGGSAALGPDQEVMTVALYPHQRRLADLSALRSSGRDDDDRQSGVEQGVGLATTGSLVVTDLVAHPLSWARLVLTFESHRPRLGGWLSRYGRSGSSRPPAG